MTLTDYPIYQQEVIRAIEEFGPGEIGIIPPGHDGWTVGN